MKRLWLDQLSFNLTFWARVFINLDTQYILLVRVIFSAYIYIKKVFFKFTIIFCKFWQNSKCIIRIDFVTGDIE